MNKTFGLVPQLVIDDLTEFFNNSKYRGEATAHKYGGSIIIGFADGSKAKICCSMWQGDEVILEHPQPAGASVEQAGNDAALTQPAPAAVSAGTWRKASERTSLKHSSELHWRFSHSKKPICSPFHLVLGELIQEYNNTRAKYKLNEIEWLDESATGIPDVSELVEALTKVAKWELPATGRFWDDDETRPMSYASCYGSNGVRDYFRQLAQKALGI